MHCLGAFIKLTGNCLNKITYIDTDDPNSCEKLIFPNLTIYHLEFNLDRFRRLYRMTDLEAVEYAFKTTLYLVLSKIRLQKVSFTININKMEISLFEYLVKCISRFLVIYNAKMNHGHVALLLRYRSYDSFDENRERWDNAWHHLKGIFFIIFLHFLRLLKYGALKLFLIF